MVDIAQQRGKVVIAHQRGKSRYSGASWKRESQRSSVEKVDIAQQR